MHTMVPGEACIQDVFKVRVEVNGHVIGTLLCLSFVGAVVYWQVWALCK